ncbi:MAG: hypothetical protein HY791_00950 [Deltaproteobacteria bacterium]|nr:hypothetical protein [Deltaproteobacteria bacterium]
MVPFEMIAVLFALALVAQSDPAARGLDLFVVAPRSFSASSFPVAVEVYGFAQTKIAKTLPGARVEISASFPNQDPTTVAALTDASGRAILTVEVPTGKGDELMLIVSAAAGERTRTKELTVARSSDVELELFSDSLEVAPGSNVHAFARLRTRGQANSRTRISFELQDGPRTLTTRSSFTDESGVAVVAVPMPKAEARALTIVATAWSAKEILAKATVALRARDDTPGRAELVARFDESSVLPGHEVALSLGARDAAKAPIADVSIRYWVGLSNSRPKDDGAFLDRSAIAITPSDGTATIRVAAPSIVPQRGGELVVLARAELDGRPMEAHASIDVRRPSSQLVAFVEGGKLVPGLEQELTLRVSDDLGRPVVGRARIEADGLRVETTTSQAGEATVRFRVPESIGSRHASGSCAEEVAATISVTLLGTSERLRSCVLVDREAVAFLRATPPVVRAGERVTVEVVGDDGLWALSLEGTPIQTVFVRQRAEFEVHSESTGSFALSAISPGGRHRALPAAILVRPRELTQVSVAIAGGRQTPGGFVDLDVALTDEGGRPVRGSVTAAIVDARSGASLAGLLELDARHALARSLDLGFHELDSILGPATELDAARRVALLTEATQLDLFVDDPMARLDESVRTTFRDVVRQLEGAIYEATSGELADARVLREGRSELNPELLTIVSEALSEPPLTPGGEPITLADLVAIDPQVRYDLVARRVTRLKLFRLWAALRQQILDARATEQDPLLADPSVMLRRLVREGSIDPTQLVDAWGGTIAFVKGRGPGLPYFGTSGHHLASPGPDGRMGTSDDLHDPFARVLRSGTPYAEAVEEDALVDARDDIVVSDEVVENWRSVLERSTGDSFGDSEGGLGMGSFGSGGGGGGLGTSAARIQTRGAFATPGAFLAPIRTDERGRARLRVPLGPEETTWTVGVVALPTQGPSAVALLDVPSALPLSVRVEVGRGWHVGDRAMVPIVARNRTSERLTAELSLSVNGAARAAKESRLAALEVPPGSERQTFVELMAVEPGWATIIAKASSKQWTDEVELSWPVRARGTEHVVSVTRSVTGEADLELLPVGVPIGPARLEVSRGLQSLLQRVLTGLDSASPSGALDALEVSGRITLACAKEPNPSELCSLARERAGDAWGRLKPNQLTWLEKLRAHRYSESALPAPSPCPPTGAAPTNAEELVDALAAEPDPVGGVVRRCWDELAFKASQLSSSDLSITAELIIVMLDRAHRRDAALALARRLEALVRPDGRLRLDEATPGLEALIRAALAKAHGESTHEVLALERSEGGFGTTRVTKFVLAALRVEEAETECEAEVRTAGRPSLGILLGPNDSTAVTFDRFTKSASLSVETACRLDARLTQTVLRPWDLPPPVSTSGLELEAKWPKLASAHERETLRLTLDDRGETPHGVVVRIPLPPGAHLYESVEGVSVKESMGILTLETRLADVAEVIDLPLRFTLPGEFSVPEIELDSAEREVEPARSRADRIRVTP